MLHKNGSFFSYHSVYVHQIFTFSLRNANFKSVILKIKFGVYVVMGFWP